MRILFVSLVEAYWAGSEILWSEAAMAAIRQGWTVAASFPYYKNVPQIHQLHSSGVQLFFGSPPPQRWWCRIGQRKLTRHSRFTKALDEFSPELVLLNQGGVRDGLAEMSECRRRGLPYAILNQAVEPLFYGDCIWHDLRKAFAEAVQVWFVSSENQRACLDYLQLPLERSSVILNAYNCSFDVQSSWPTGTDPIRLAMVARLTPFQKGQDLVLKILADPKWRNRRLEVSFFGEGDSHAQLENRRSALNLESVHIPGISVDVAEIWKDHHALLLPSRFEGQSLAMIEAMLHSRPVISTPVGGTTGVVIDGQTGFLASSVNHIAALDDALERAWQQRAHWQKIGEQARTHIRTLVSPNPGLDFIRRIEQIRP